MKIKIIILICFLFIFLVGYISALFLNGTNKTITYPDGNSEVTLLKFLYQKYIVDPATKTITYPDGCSEIWYKGELQSKFICNEGRILQAELNVGET